MRDYFWLGHKYLGFLGHTLIVYWGHEHLTLFSFAFANNTGNSYIIFLIN